MHAENAGRFKAEAEDLRVKLVFALKKGSADLDTVVVPAVRLGQSLGRTSAASSGAQPAWLNMLYNLSLCLGRVVPESTLDWAQHGWAQPRNASSAK